MDTSLSAMFASRAGLSSSSHNIANANTPGYNRQETLFKTRYEKDQYNAMRPLGGPASEIIHDRRPAAHSRTDDLAEIEGYIKNLEKVQLEEELRGVRTTPETGAVR